MASSSGSEPTADETRNWLELPQDVTAMILHRIGAIDILTNAQNVCKTWRQICRDPAMWRSIDVRISGSIWEVPDYLEKMAKHAIDRSLGQLVDVNFEYFGTNDLLHHISHQTSQLRCLRLACCDYISSDGLSEAVKRLPLLEELHIYYCYISKEALETIGRCCPLLKSFKLNIKGYRHPHMESDAEAQAVAENMPSLRHLQLFGNQMTNDGVQAILDGCPHLESLDIRQCFNVNPGGDLGRRLSERIKDLRLPHDSTEDCGFDFQIHDDESFDDEYPSAFCDIDLWSGVDDSYKFSGSSDFCESEEMF